jgi:spore coat protein A, manganese oxidase
MIKPNRKTALVLIITLVLSMFFGAFSIQPAKAAAPLDPGTILKYNEDLVWNIPIYKPTNITVGGVVVEQDYVINATQFDEQILPTGFPMTTVWGYGGNCTLNGVDIGYFRNSPSATFVATENLPSKITWINNLTTTSGALLNYLYPVDPTIMWANPRNIPIETAVTLASMGLAPPYPGGYNGSAILVGNTYTNPFQWNAQSPAPIVTHVHGAEVVSGSDGGPAQWFTPDGIHGPDYFTAEPTYPNAAVFYYNNTQQPSTIWYHDHALGLTRINVYSGLAGYYLITNPNDPIAPLLPSGTHDIPLAIQDRSFYDNGSLRFDVDPPPNPTLHPYWVPEFFGDTFMVNGKTWPALNVTQSTYRFRVLDGCNARFLNLSLVDLDAGNATVPFTMFARDQGYLNASIAMNNMLIGPGMRAEILVNFTGITTGHRILMKNSAAAPFPTGNPVSIGTTDEVIMFKVGGADAAPQYNLPTTLNPTLTGTTWPTLPASTVVRQRNLTNIEVMGPGGPMMILQDGQTFESPASELPVVGTTEQWNIINPTADAHPMHWHLVQFQLVSRQPFDDVGYVNTWLTLNGGEPPFNHPTINVGNLSAYFTGPAVLPGPEEQGWLDTVTAWPGQITTVRIRYTQQNGTAYSIDTTTGQGYVWHCHIVDHEDNEMMRRLNPINPSQLPNMYAAVRGMNNFVYYRTYLDGTDTWGTWTMLPAQITYASPAVTSYGGNLYFAIQGSDNASMYFGSVNITSNAFSGWTLLSGSTISAPTLSSYGSKIVLVVRGSNNLIYTRIYNADSNTWTGWIADGQATCDSPAAAVVLDTLHLVARGYSPTNVAINNTLYHASWNLTDNNVTPWTAIPGALTNAAPQMATPLNENTLYVAMKGLTNLIYYAKWDGTSWSAAIQIPTGSTDSSPAVTVINGQLQLVVKGNGTNGIYEYFITITNNAITSWRLIGGSTPSGPRVTR